MHYRVTTIAKSSATTTTGSIEIQHHHPKTSTPKPRRKRRNVRPCQQNDNKVTFLWRYNSRSVILVCTLVVGVVFLCIIVLMSGSNCTIPQNGCALDKYRDLYDSQYKLAHTQNGTATYHPTNQYTRSYARRSLDPNRMWLQQSSTYGSNVKTCPLTIVFLDPRLGDRDYGHGQSTWFALESAAYALPQACVVLFTSDCLWTDNASSGGGEGKGGYGSTHEDHLSIQQSIRKDIYEKALPLFRTMIEQGRVRLTFLNWESYKLHSCNDYRKLSSVLMNVHFWRDEFLNQVDNDLVLTLQADSALCDGPFVLNDDGTSTSTLELLKTKYGHYSYTGAPWPPKANELSPFPPEGMCQGMAIRWRSWLLPQRKWERTQEHGKDDSVPRPYILLKYEFPPICVDGKGPVGNGGLSLRSRAWMIRVIESCPHVHMSGLDTSVSANRQYPCKVLEEVNEDLYFSTILNGLEAPLPPAVEAAAFAVESLWPNDALEMYGYTDTTMETLSGRPLFSYKGRHIAAPIGIHKSFWYHPNDMLRSDDLYSVCPFFRYVFVPSESRWKSVENTPTEQSWLGIGI